MSCKKKSCGCEDTGLTTPSPCPHDAYTCPDPEKCSETFSDDCVIHDGDGIVDIGVETGDSLSEILQKVALFLTNPACVDPEATCLSPLWLHSITVTPYTIKVGWTSAGTPVGFQVEYKTVAAMSWTLNPAVIASSTSDTIGGLTADTDYQIRVKGTCALGSCYSVTILVKTKPV